MKQQPIRCFEGTKQPHQPFWTVRNAADSPSQEPEIEFYGYISEFICWGDEITPKLFKDALYGAGNGGPVTVRINSGGGDLIAASVIRSIMMDYPGQITTRIDGIAGSAAVAVALAGRRVLIQDTAYVMVHDPMISIFYADLNIEAMEDLIRELKAIRIGLVDTYAARTGLTPEKISRMMADETWLSANEAVRMGFADEVITAGERVPVDRAALKNCVHVPADLRPESRPAVVNAVDPEVETLRVRAKLLKPRS